MLAWFHSSYAFLYFWIGRRSYQSNSSSLLCKLYGGHECETSMKHTHHVCLQFPTVASVMRRFELVTSGRGAVVSPAPRQESKVRCGAAGLA